MPTLQQIRDAVNARLADLWPKFQNRQATYFANHGRYFQGLIWSSVPDDGATVSPNLSVAPNDCFTPVPAVLNVQGEIVTPATTIPHSWSHFGAGADLPAQVEAQFRCDVYQAPGGVHGYRLTCRISKDGVTYSRTGEVRAGEVVSTGTWGAE